MIKIPRPEYPNSHNQTQHLLSFSCLMPAPKASHFIPSCDHIIRHSAKESREAIMLIAMSLRDTMNFEIGSGFQSFPSAMTETAFVVDA
jgi:hypothetical protein